MSERMLPEVVVLRHPDDPAHPVWDLERLARVVLDGHLRNIRRRLALRDYDEALGFLLGESYILAPRYDARRGRVPFAAWLQGQLAFRVRDHLRAPYGTRSEDRLGEGLLDDGRPVNPHNGDPLDIDPIDAVEDAEPARGSRLDAALAGVEADALDDRVTALAGLLVRRGRQDLGTLFGLGNGAGREGPGRDSGADREVAGSLNGRRAA